MPSPVLSSFSGPCWPGFMGPWAPHHLVLIDRILAHIDFLEQSIAQVQEELWLAHPAGLPV